MMTYVRYLVLGQPIHHRTVRGDRRVGVRDGAVAPVRHRDEQKLLKYALRLLPLRRHGSRVGAQSSAPLTPPPPLSRDVPFLLPSTIEAGPG